MHLLLAQDHHFLKVNDAFLLSLHHVFSMLSAADCFCLCLCATHAQTSEIFFQHTFLTSIDTAGPSLLGPLTQILSLGLSAAAVTNYVQSVSVCTVSLPTVHRTYMQIVLTLPGRRSMLSRLHSVSKPGPISRLDSLLDLLCWCHSCM